MKVKMTGPLTPFLFKPAMLPNLFDLYDPQDPTRCVLTNLGVEAKSKLESETRMMQFTSALTVPGFRCTVQRDQAGGFVIVDRLTSRWISWSFVTAELASDVAELINNYFQHLARDQEALPPTLSLADCTDVDQQSSEDVDLVEPEAIEEITIEPPDTMVSVSPLTWLYSKIQSRVKLVRSHDGQYSFSKDVDGPWYFGIPEQELDRILNFFGDLKSKDEHREPKIEKSRD